MKKTFIIASLFSIIYGYSVKADNGDKLPASVTKVLKEIGISPEAFLEKIKHLQSLIAEKNEDQLILEYSEIEDLINKKLHPEIVNSINENSN